MDYVDYDDPISSLRYIGPYLEENFASKSFWPPGSNNARPISTLQELINFIRTRSGNDIPATRSRVKEWLMEIMRNERSGQCVEPAKLRGGADYLYKVRQSNVKGYNTIIDFLRDNFEGTIHYDKIPRRLPNLPETQKYPNICRT